MTEIPSIKVKKIMCGYPDCKHLWLRTKEGNPTGCPKCKRKFVGKKPIILLETEI
jgi:uncharacterized CHY-type Zn-finger protein